MHCRADLGTFEPPTSLFPPSHEQDQKTPQSPQRIRLIQLLRTELLLKLQLPSCTPTFVHPLLSVLAHSDMTSDASALPPVILYSKPAPTTSPSSPSRPLLGCADKTGVDDDGPWTTSLASRKAPVSSVEDTPEHTVEGVA